MTMKLFCNGRGKIKGFFSVMKLCNLKQIDIGKIIYNLTKLYLWNKLWMNVLEY